MVMLQSEIVESVRVETNLGVIYDRLPIELVITQH
jgi:hypothetical protein